MKIYDNDLATKNPELAKEWHPTKNGYLKPTDVTSGSNKKVWWMLKHIDENSKEWIFEWEATISNRSSGEGCPYLLGKKVYVGFNDLATKNPELAKEWHPTKNGYLKPTDVTSWSNKKVWWMLKHIDENSKEWIFEWETAISNRNNGAGCPYLLGKKVYVGYNDLATKNPELAKEWHPIKNGDLKPTDVTSGSNKKVWWMLKYIDENSKEWIFEWEAPIIQRVKGLGCPYLLGKKIHVGFNDLATKNPELAKEWHPTKNGNLKPTDVSAGSSLKVWWLLKHTDEKGMMREFEWKASINSRNNNKTSCPFISNHRVYPGFNDLATKNPELASEWHPTKNGDLKPTDVTTGSKIKIWWICRYTELHEWQSSIANRVMGRGCPMCSGQKVSRDNCLETLMPDIAMQWNYDKNGSLTPRNVTVGSGKLVWWKCENGHEWKSTIVNRVKAKGCPLCNQL